MNLSTYKAHERLDRIVVVDLGELSKRTARRRHTNAWNLPPLDDGDGAVHAVSRGRYGEMAPAEIPHQCVMPKSFRRRREMAKERSALLSRIRTAAEGARKKR